MLVDVKGHTFDPFAYLLKLVVFLVVDTATYGSDNLYGDGVTLWV